MREIASYVATLRQEIGERAPDSAGDSLVEGSQSKKRKLDDLKNGKSELSRGRTQANLDGEWKCSVQFADVSFTIPQRKKMTLEIGMGKHEGVRAVNVATRSPEAAVPYSEVG